jgi:hypothetical protein
MQQLKLSVFSATLAMTRSALLLWKTMGSNYTGRIEVDLRTHVSQQCHEVYTRSHPGFQW